jgi:hypothetical protein
MSERSRRLLRSPAKKDPPFVALWRVSEDAFWSKAGRWYSGSGMTTRCDPARAVHLKILPDGDPQKLPRMVPTMDWAPPSFPTNPSTMRKSSATLRGPGPASLNSGYGSTDRSIEKGAPFWKATGVFWRASKCPGWNEPTRRSAVNSEEFSEQEPRRPRISRAEITQHVADLGRGFAARRKGRLL